jgi:hypothetical protein
MALSNAPGEWRWENRGTRGWWRVNDQLSIEDGPHTEPSSTEPSRNRILTKAEWTEQDERDRWLDEMQ